MAEVVNLRARRKAAARKDDRAQADENAAKFGRTKAQKALEAAETERARAKLDGKKFEKP